MNTTCLQNNLIKRNDAILELIFLTLKVTEVN